MTNRYSSRVGVNDPAAIGDFNLAPGAVAGGQVLLAGSVDPYRFVASDRLVAAPGDNLIIGITGPEGGLINEKVFLGAPGIRIVEADCPLAIGDYIKVGGGGRATLFNATASATRIKDDAAGVDSDFTQPGAATTLEVLQASNIAADAGKVIRVEGADGGGAAIYEDFTLDATDTTTVISGAVTFTTICAAYTLDGSTVGADITIREEDDTGVTTLPSGDASIGVVAPDAEDAYSQLVTIAGPNADASFVTLVGVDPDGADIRERVTMDGASPAAGVTTLRFRVVTYILVGEATDGENFDVGTGADDSQLSLGYCLQPAARSGLTVLSFQPLALSLPQVLQGRIHMDLLDGQDGGSTPAYTLSGIAVGDEIVFVGHLTTKASIASLADVTSGFSITDTDEISSATDYSNDQMLVFWIDRTP